MTKGFYESFLRPALFKTDAEKAHHLAMTALRAGSATPAGRLLMRSLYTARDARLSQTLWGITFPNPVGLAAGFDKNAEAVTCWQNLGFGFCEIGTVTARAQSGNPKPRLFRLPEDCALINRMGFNNIGAQAMAEHLARVLAKKSVMKVPLGINIGKSKSASSAETIDDYLFSFEKLFPYAGYFVVNVSSPNTPGLRALQNKGELEGLLKKIIEKNKKLADKNGITPTPLLVKLAPDMHDEMLTDSLDLLVDLGISGVILTNTTVAREGLKSQLAVQQGGLSGAPLKQRSTEMIRVAHGHVGEKLVIVGSGGIFSPDDAWEKIQAGAKLVQVYTGFIYEGPTLPKRINEGLLQKGFGATPSGA